MEDLFSGFVIIFSTNNVEPEEFPAPEKVMVFSPNFVLFCLIVVLRWRFAPLSTNFVANAFSNQERRTAVSDVVGI